MRPAVVDGHEITVEMMCVRVSTSSYTFSFHFWTNPWWYEGEESQKSVRRPKGDVTEGSGPDYHLNHGVVYIYSTR